MTNSPKLVTIFGGSGFVGRYIARRMAKQGWRVRVAVRRPNEALFVRGFGAVGQVDPVLANVGNEASVRAMIAGADVVVNCVGTLVESSRQKFEALHHEAAARIARVATEAGVSRLVHISSLSADLESESEYARTKAAGDAAVLAEFPGAVILRPSVIFGPEDEFFNRFALMARFTMVLPLVGAKTLFQPIYVDDVAAAAEMAMTGDAEAGVYELGGPSVHSFRDLMRGMLHVVRRRRALINIPFMFARIDAWFLDMGAAATFGMFTNKILTRDQVRLLRHDTVVGEGARTLSDLGVEATPMEAILESYLYCHRANGQYTAIKESAANLKA
ncbi:MAG: complex I NDUFA9 subunit family protein [Alphaproteobacteria bacterium]|nr:complex I NDUFA9 subunit family protein [Alphaproteobacteria bacterium]